MIRLLTSRKIWGAFIGSICIMALVKLTPTESIGNVVVVVGGLWTLAIGGQAVKDYVKASKKDV